MILYVMIVQIRQVITINKLYNDDCISVMNKMKNDNMKVKMIITDPPYIHEKGGRGKMLLGNSLDRNEFNMKELGDFGKDNIYTFLDVSKRIMEKPQWYIFCSEKQLVYYLNWTHENKLKYNLLTWNKPLSVLNRERYSTNIEYIIRIYDNGCALNKLDLDNFPDKTKYYSKYKTYNQIRGKNKLHPSQKPIELLKEIIEVSSNLNDVILDPYMGSASTGVACNELGRDFIGIELNNTYYNIAQERIGA